MSNKIIIDGVDVSECAYFDYENDGYEDSCYIHDNECSAQFCYFKQMQRLKAELQKYKDMEAKGLEEFKEIGGCWGCGIQLSLNQAWEDIKRLKAENEELKQYKKSKQASYETMQAECNRVINENRELKKWLEEERQSNDKLNQLYQDEHCEVLELANRMSFLNADRTAEIMELKQALEEIREISEKTGCRRFVDIVNEVLK